MRRDRALAPGIWLDADDVLHFAIPEILAHLGLPDTPDDRALAGAVIVKVMARLAPGARPIDLADDERAN